MAKYAPRNAEGDHRILKDDPEAIALLKDEHHRFRELFDKAEDAEGEALVPIARELCLRLAVHMTIEEELLYPAVKDLGDEEKDEVDEGIVEHASGKALCAEIEQLDGFCSTSMMCDRSTGRAVVSTTYDSQDAMERSRDAARSLRTALLRDLGADQLDVGEFELAIARLRVPELA